MLFNTHMNAIQVGTNKKTLMGEEGLIEMEDLKLNTIN